MNFTFGLFLCFEQFDPCLKNTDSIVKGADSLVELKIEPERDTQLKTICLQLKFILAIDQMLKI